jgi:hypothetical protein
MLMSEKAESSDGFIVFSRRIRTMQASTAIVTAIASMTKLSMAVRNLPAEFSAIAPQSRSSRQIVAKNSLAAWAVTCRLEPEPPCSVSIPLLLDIKLLWLCLVAEHFANIQLVQKSFSGTKAFQQSSPYPPAPAAKHFEQGTFL